MLAAIITFFTSGIFQVMRLFRCFSQTNPYRVIKVTINGEEVTEKNYSNNIIFPIMDVDVTICRKDKKESSSLKYL